MKNKLKFTSIFLSILLLAAFFRLYGINWDQNQHFHPDERFLTMVAGDMTWPTTIFEYFNTATSQLNPHNISFTFFVYGTLPILMVKAVADATGLNSYSTLTFVGRALSAGFDLLTLVLVFLIALRISKKKWVGLVAAFLYATSVLPIQLSHFFASDPPLTFFLTLVLYFLVSHRLGFPLGVSLGLAMSTKISAITIAAPVAISYLYSFVKTDKIFTLLTGVLMVLSAFIVLRISYPYFFISGSLFSPNPLVLGNWQQLRSFEDPNAMFPPSYQWVHTTPWVFPFLNMLFFGLGVPQMFLTVTAIVYLLWKRKLTPEAWVLLAYVIVVFLYQGYQFAKPLRYLYPIYPSLAILCALGIAAMKKFPSWIYGLAVALLLLWPIMFMALYTRSHSRVTASEWIYNNIPTGSVLSGEHWDDFLPVTLGDKIHERYASVEIPVFLPDVEEKWTQIDQSLKKADYVIMSSNRGYGSLTGLPERFPKTRNYYHKLFDGSLGFEKVAEFSSRPTLPLPFVSLCLTPPGLSYGRLSEDPLQCGKGVSIVDDYADETWTVYDHPKVTIFKKVRRVDYLKELFGTVNE